MRVYRLVLALALLSPALAAQAPLEPPGTGGVPALAHLLRQLGADKRVLLIAAHPDDEDTQLLVLLTRGLGAQAAYLSLTRGEGGQNLIGPELGTELGVVRTAELLAARELDGARQYFTRAYDFGFSKTAEETFRFWPRDSILTDVLDVMRRFRPQIVVSVFSGTPRDGHGQHQVAGMLAREAFDRLRDSTWGPIALYRSTRFDSAATTLALPTGTVDPLLGHSFLQIAAASRSRHRSQDMGQIQRAGPGTARLQLVATRARQPAGADGGEPGAALFAGIDTTVGAAGFAATIDSARRALDPWRPAAVLPQLARAARLLDSRRTEQRALLERAIAVAGGVAIDAVADDGIVIPGQRLQLEVTVWNTGEAAVRLESAAVQAPAGWTVARLDAADGAVAPGTVATRRFVVTVAPTAERTQPYFLRRPLLPGGGLYDWSGVPADVRGLPFGPPALTARVSLTVAGVPVALSREVVYRYRDQAIGEIRRPIVVTRPFDVAIAPVEVLWPVDGGDGMGDGARPFTITVTSRAREAATARLAAIGPRGWPPIPAESLAFSREDESRTVTVSLHPPPGELRAGDYRLRPAVQGAESGGGMGGLAVIDYPHIRPRAIARPAQARIVAAALRLPPLSAVGYVRGAADRVPEALRSAGVPVELLDAAALEGGDLSRYDAIIVGPRAYETDLALTANNGRLLDYARGGGLVIVQYQQYAFVERGFAPSPLRIARPHDRVTDETAPVTPLDPAHPVLRYPNPIGPGDWRGWVQERGLYFAREWDSTYTPVLETHDPLPDAPELKGGLLIAPLGRGTYVYTGLSFFRQLPAGVPGAFRLFVNLLGLRRRNVP